MREAVGRLGLVGCMVGVIGWLTPAEGVTYSVKAVKRNSMVITPPQSTPLTAGPNDTIELNIFVSGWNSNIAGSKLNTFQFTMNARKGYYNNGGSGFILPKGWNAARDLTMCQILADCDGLPETSCDTQDHFCRLRCNQGPLSQCPGAYPGVYPICTTGQRCVGPGHEPEIGAFIDSAANVPCKRVGVPFSCCTGDGTGTCPARSDWVFAGFGSVTTPSLPTLDYGYGSTVISGVADGPLDSGQSKYVGTLILVVSPAACGTYSVGLINDDIFATYVTLASGGATSGFAPTVQPLTINLPACGACCGPVPDLVCSLTTQALCMAGGGSSFHPEATDCDPDPCLPCPSIDSTDPPNCAIDARFPSAPAMLNPPFGFTSVDITFSREVDLPVPANFIVTVTPDPGIAQRPVIQSVTELSRSSFRLNLDPTKPVPQRRWTCFEYNVCEPRPKFCVGALAGDTDQDAEMDAADLLSLIGGLNADQIGTNPLKDYQCNMDRSPACTTADLVNWVDMAVGALQFPPLLGRTMENNTVCPTAPPP